MRVRQHLQGSKTDPSRQSSVPGIVLPVPPAPLGAYVESSDVGYLLFLSGMLPVVNRTLVVTGRLGVTLSVDDGREAARIAALNALATAKQHVARSRSVDDARQADGLDGDDRAVRRAAPWRTAADLFVKIFGPDAGHVRLVYEVQSLPVGAPLVVDAIFEIAP